jgi:NAD+ kinase
MNVGIIANPNKVGARPTLEKLAAALAAKGIGCLYADEAAMILGRDDGLGIAVLAAEVDVIAVLGGDGTMLHVMAKLGGMEKPMAGINIGTLGFLTSCTDDEIEPFAAALASGTFKLSKRTLLAVTVERAGGGLEHYLALNEVVLARGHTGRLVALRATVDGELLNRYRADGLIVATPTGSTAYSLSAGGPLISPQAGVFVITPICPHTLSQRSLVVDDDVRIELSPDDAADASMLFTIDGRDGAEVGADDRIWVERADTHLNLLRLEDRSFYLALRQKLNWWGG